LIRAALGLAAVALLASSSAWAVLPEVSNVRFQASGTLQWDSLAGTSGYNLYSGDVLGLRNGDYGSCFLGSVQSASATPNAPLPLGVAIFFLVDGFDQTGEGQVGGTPAVNPSPRCIPARRFFPLSTDGDPGDGIADGVSPLRNPSALLTSSHEETEGVILHSGEFAVSAVDLFEKKRSFTKRFAVFGHSAQCGDGSADDAVCFNPGHLGSDSALGQVTAGAGGDLPCGSCHGGTHGPTLTGLLGSSRGAPALLELSDLIRQILAFYQERYSKDAWDSTAGAARGLIRHRSFRGQVDYKGPLGHGWDMDDNMRLVPQGSNILYCDGRGRCDRFTRIDATHFTSPPGHYEVLIQNAAGSFVLRDPRGGVASFHALDGTNRQGAVEAASDPDGDQTTFLYDSQGLLTTVVDPLGRATAFAYDAAGRVQTITDFAGRQVVYSYDANDNLVSVRSPVVTGTPNGNDFPNGRLTQYTYSSGFADPRLNNNLIGVIRPDESGSGVPAVQITYGTDAAAFNFDRVISATLGGTNASGVAAGGTLTFSYQSLNSGGDPADLTLPRRQATILDRSGNQQVFVHNAQGNCISRTDFTNRNLRSGEPDYTTQFSYDSDGELILVLRPQGDKTQLVYDKPGADRYREGNLILVKSIADPHSTGGRGDGHGGESNDRTWSFTYEPIFNQLASATDPRGNDPSYVPQNGGQNTPGRYTGSWIYDYQEGDPLLNGINAYAASFGISISGGVFGVGDANGDGITSQIAGNPVKISHPAVHLDPSSMQAAIQGGTLQPIDTRIEWNSHGEPTALTDAEQNRHTFAYYPESDPDGDGTATPTPPDGRVLDPVTGGFLKTEIFDTILSPGRDNGRNPGPINMHVDLKYDPIGFLAAAIDGRGVETRTIHNALGELVEIREAAATADSSGPDGTPPTGRGESGLTAFGFLQRFAYDADGDIVTLQSQDQGATRGVGPFVSVNRTFDILGDPLQTSRQAASSVTLTTLFRYDADQNLTQVTEPDGNRRDRAYDERDLLLTATRGAAGPLGGSPSTRSYDYNGDGNLSRLTDGRGGITDFLYDGHDRLARTVDPVGGTGDLYYDPAGNAVRNLSRGTSGGPTPTDRSGGSNVDLADLKLLYDEVSRAFRADRMLFVPAGVFPGRAPSITEGSLLPGDGAVNGIFEYDRLSRPSFLHADSGALTRLDYDGAGRMMEKTDAAGDTLDLTYDAAGNAVESVETELSSNPGPLQEQFLTTFFYDSLGRTTMAVDNLGETSRRLYDSLGGVVIVTDANGPAGGSISRRSPGHTGMTVPVNSHGNVTRFTYDGAGRTLTLVQVLTASGKGNGTTTPPPDTSNPSNADGLITSSWSWTNNSLLLQALDDKGNATTYAYDNLDRGVHLGRSDGFLQQIGYDGEDAVVSGLDPNGTHVTSSVDFVGRTTARAITPGPGVAGTTLQSYEYDGLSRLTRAVDPNMPTDSSDDTNIVFYYDSLGRLLEEAQLPAGSGGTPRYSDLAWQADGLLTGLTYPDGDQVSYGYDGAGRVRNMSDMLHPELTASFDYFGLGRLHTRVSGNGVRLTFLDDSGTVDTGYDGARRVVLMRHLDSTNSLLAGFEYRYDRVGAPTSVRRLHDAIAGGGRRGNVYAYDSAERLISSQEAYLDANHNIIAPVLDSQAWTLDGPGNWARLTRNGALFLNTPNNLNEYDETQCCGSHAEDGIPDDFLDPASTPLADGSNLTYDNNGNQTDTIGKSVGYNFADLPVSAFSLVGGGQIASYAYDALARRTRHVVTGGDGSTGMRSEAYAGGVLPEAVEEDDASGGLAMQYAVGPGGGCIWHVRGDGSTQYLLEDALGSAVALTPGTATGGAGVLERVVYDPYGKPTFEDASNNPIFSPLGTFLAESQYDNHHLFGGMHYDPELGARGASGGSDFGGLYSGGGIYNPTEGRSMSAGTGVSVQPTGSNGNGGSISLSSGAGSIGTGGTINLSSSGSGTIGVGGAPSVSLRSGTVGVGGTIVLTGNGAGNGKGGTIVLTSGSGSIGSGGTIVLSSGSGSIGEGSGLAEVSGNDAIVSLGPDISYLAPDAITRAEAGTIMHELGHDLGLWHGGAGSANGAGNGKGGTISLSSGSGSIGSGGTITLSSGSGSIGSTSGLARLMGNDIIVSLGLDILSLAPDVLTRTEAGAILHELGHNLALNHGGASSSDGSDSSKYVVPIDELVFTFASGGLSPSESHAFELVGPVMFNPGNRRATAEVPCPPDCSTAPAAP
jgi:YD repeat-containing protein